MDDQYPPTHSATTQQPAGFIDAISESSRSGAIIDFDLGHGIDDPHLDAICRAVARQCDVPIALVSLVDEAEQRFLGKAGTDLCGTARSTSFCATAMLDQAVMIVPDARLDPRFADYSIVTGEPHVRFYAGAPLITAEGIPLGALCVLDTQPHPDGLSAVQEETLRLFADAVMDHLSLRRAARDERVAAHHAAAALGESELRFHLLADAMPQMAWSSRPDGYSDYFNARWYEFTGLRTGASEGEEWTLCLHPDDVERTGVAWRHSLETGEPYDIEYRLRRADGTYRWTLTRGLPMHAEDGRIIRWFGTCTDIHDHRVAMEEREIISQELSHRIKNIFAVISGLIGLSAREMPAFRPIADMLRERILALGRAHDFVRPHSRDSRPEPVKENSLHGLLTDLFAPYEDSPGARVRISGEDIAIDDRSATPLALLFHEVVTNAAKYGALSVADGHAELAVHMDGADHVEMLWRENGGPIVGNISHSGFGSRLLDLSVRRQLGGDFEQQWPAQGLVMKVRVPLTAFSRQRRG
ncbi:MAG TPA: PAS domain-containing protein [Sphingobium sp.]